MATIWRPVTAALYQARPLAVRLSSSGTTPPLPRALPRVSDPAAADEVGEVGHLPGTAIRIVPLRRADEDDGCLRARLVYQSRKRGTLESDLLLSTFADAHLTAMPRPLLVEYDKLLDENDWDIYYWATQQADTTAARPAQAQTVRQPVEGEWAYTIGSFQPAYTPLPDRWRDSPVVQMLRQHVRQRSSVGGGGGNGGLGLMPQLRR